MKLVEQLVSGRTGHVYIRKDDFSLSAGPKGAGHDLGLQSCELVSHPVLLNSIFLPDTDGRYG